ncbi:hypothetical protein QTP88_026031 [Uroleucon formosanum]
MDMGTVFFDTSRSPLHVALVVKGQAHTIQNLNSNELSSSLSNEQVTEYNYERTIKSATTDNNQAHSVTTNIKTDFVHTIHSSKELDLGIADSTDIDETLNMEIMSELNMLNNNEASTNNDYAKQSTFEISNTEVKIEGDTTFISPNEINNSPNYNTPTNTNGDLTHKTNRQDNYSNGNKLSDSSFTNNYHSSSYNGYGIQNQVDNNGGIPTMPKSFPSSKDSPSNETPTSPNKNINSAPNSNQNSAPQLTAQSATNSNQYPFSSSPQSPNGDSTGQTNGQDNYSNGNMLSDSSFTNNYQSFSYIGYGIQNQVDNNGGIPTFPKSSPSSKDSPSNETPTSPDKNINSGPNSNQNAAPQLTAPSATNSNQYPFSSTPQSPNGESTGQTNGQDNYSNGNMLSDSSFPNNYHSSSYNGYGIQNQVDNNGGIPTFPKSSPSSKDSPSNETPTSPDKNINSGPNSNQNAAPQLTAPSATNSNQYPFSSTPQSPNGESTGQTNGQDNYSNGNMLSDSSFPNNYHSSSYNGYGIQNQVDNNGGIPTLPKSSPSSKDSPSNETPTSPNKNINSAPNSDQKAAPQLTAPSATNSNQYPFSSTPQSPNGDSTGQTNGQDNDSNGNMLSDSSFTNNYQSFSYIGYGIQNQVDNNGGIPTFPKSSPSSKDSPSNETPTSPDKNINSGPNSNQNAAPQLTAPSATNSNQYPFSSTPQSPNGESTGQTNGQDNYSNGNKLSDSSFPNNYHSSSYNGYGIQNQVDNNGGIPTLPKSSPSSKDSPSNETPTSPDKNINSGPNSNQNAAPQLTAPSATNSNQYPFSSTPQSPNGESTGQTNGQDNYSNGNKLSDSSFPNNYHSSSYNGYGIQNQVDNNGGIPTLPKSSPSSKDSPSNETPTSPNKNINSAPNSDQKAAPQLTAPSATNSNQYPFSSSPQSPNGDSTGRRNGQDNYSNGNMLSDSSFPNNYHSSSYNGYGIQNQVDNNGGIPTLPKSSPSSKDSPSNETPTSPNKNINSAPNSDQNAAPQLTAPSATNSYQYPFSSSPQSPNGESTGQTNGQDNDSNGKMLSDSSFTNNYQSFSYIGYGIQNQVDNNGGIPTFPKSSLSSKDSPSNITPTSPNQNINSGPNSNQNAAPQLTAPSATNSNQYPFSSTPQSPNGDSTGQTNGQDNYSNRNKLSDSSFPNNYHSSSYNGYGIQNQVDNNGGIPTLPKSSPSSKDSPSNETPTSPNKNINSGPNSNQNAAPQLTAPSATNPNQYPFSSSPQSPNGESTVQTNGQDGDSNGNKLNDQSLNYYEYIQNTENEDRSSYYPPDISEYLNNQILQNSVSTFNLQNTDMADQFGFMPSNPLNMPKGNSKDSPTGGATGLNTPSDMNGLPYTVDQSSIGTEYSSFGAETYGSFNYDSNYELWNMDVVEVSNDEQLNMDDKYISINSDDVNNARVNIPILNENGGDYNNFFYADNSVNTVRSLDGNFVTKNNENYADGYFGMIGYMQEPFNEPYAPNLNARYENSQLQFNQNSPPFKGYPYMGNDIEPFDTNSYADISPQIPIMNLDLYNSNNIGGIKYDQTNIGTDETSLENNLYNGQGFIGYNNMVPINVPEYNQFTGDYTKPYMSNLGSFETSSSNTRSDAAVDGPEGPYITPQLLNSNYNLPTSNDLNKQSTDLNSLLIDNAQFNGYLYHKIDTSNVNNQVEDFTADNSNVSPMNAVDNRFNSIQTTVLSKSIVLDVGQNVYDANGQVIGIINKPSGIVKTKNRHTFSGSSSYNSPNDSEFSDDIDAIGQDIKRGARDTISNLHDNIKDVHDTTKAIAKNVGNIAGNAASKAADGIKETTKTAYQDSKDTLKSVGNAVGEAVNDVEETAKTAYQGSKDAENGIENAISDAADDVEETAV